MKLTLKEMLTINHKRYNAYRKSLKKMDTEEIKMLAEYYETEDCKAKSSTALIDKILPYTWMGAYARAARAELATR